MYSIDWARLFSRPPRTTREENTRGNQEPRPLRNPLRMPIGRIVWYLGFTSFFTDVSSEMVSSILPIYLVLYLHLSPITFGTIDGLYQGFAAIARLAGGFLADRWRSHKAVAVFGYGLSAVCKLALLAAGNAWGLLAATIAVERTGKGIRTAPRDTLISLNTDRADLATAFGIHRALDAAGAMLGPLVAFLLFSMLQNAFDAIFVVSFCVALVGVGVILFFVDGSKHNTSASEASVSLAGALGLLRIQAFRNLCVAGTIVSFATVSDSFIFLTLQRQVAFGAQYFPLLYVGVAGFNSLLSVPFGRMADRRGRWRTFLAGHVVLLLVYAAAISTGSGRMGLIGTLLLFGSYYAATDGVLTATASAALPAHLCGSGLALLVTLTNTARLLGSVLFGALWQWSGLANAILVFGAMLTAAIVTASIIRPTPKVPSPMAP